VADFHSLRHGFITYLVTANVPPKVAQMLARHSTISLTMDRYTHLRREDLAGALDVLPDLSSPIRQAALATGTDGKQADNFVSPSLSLNGEIGRNPVAFGAINSGLLATDGTSGKINRNSSFPEGKVPVGLLAELADAMDSKSIARKGISVRLR